jgi:hypothetical protein
MDQSKKPLPLTPAMRTALMLKITKAAHANPEYKNHVEEKLKEVNERNQEKKE